MRTLEKSKKLDHVAYDVRGPVLDAAMEMERQGETIIKLNIGNPAPFGFRSPAPVVEAMRQGLTLTQGYTDSKGLPAAREAIAAYHRTKGIAGVSADDIYTGNGVSELILLGMQALLDPGDQVLVPAPDYPLWTAAVTLSGGTAVHYVCDEAADWMPDLVDIRRKITDHTKALVLINPNNPTGAVYSREILEGIADICREHELLVFADEIYDRLLMDEQTHTSFAALAGDLFVVTYNGLSKSHLIAGYRCGWMCLSGDKRHAKGYIQGLNLLSSLRLCANVPAQCAVPAALNCLDATKALFMPGGRIYEQRRAVCQALDQIDGLSYIKPRASFYMFPKLDAARFGIQDDERFALDFLRQEHVLLVHGSGFHWATPDHFRIVFLPETKVLTEAVGRLGRFLSHYRQIA